MTELMERNTWTALDAHETASELALKYADRIRGKIIVVTGASSYSIGGEFVRAVAKASPKTIVLAGSSKTRLQATIDSAKSAAGQAAEGVEFKFVEMNLASQASVRKAAAEIAASVPHIDALVMSAGVMATPYTLTEDGIEEQFGINHIGHFLLTNLLLDKILIAGKQSNGQARIVVVSSDGHRWARLLFDELPSYGKNGETYDKWKGYGVSKTANALFAFDLANRLRNKGVQAFAVQPGFVASGNIVDGKRVLGLQRHMTQEDFEMLGVTWDNGKLSIPAGTGRVKDLPEGAATNMYAAFDPEIADESGAYLRDLKVAKGSVSEWIHDPVDAKKLWTLSEKLVGQEFKV